MFVYVCFSIISSDDNDRDGCGEGGSDGGVVSRIVIPAGCVIGNNGSINGDILLQA